MSLDDRARSILKKLSNLAKSKMVSFQSISTAFLIERLVARLTSDPALQKNLVFKGGFVGLMAYKSSRYTVDLDVLLFKIQVDEALRQAQILAETDIGDATWFKYENSINLTTQGEYGGIRQVYRSGIGAPLKDLRRAQIIHLDIGIGDPVTPHPIRAEFRELLGTSELSWQIYPIETMIAEKIHALVDRGARSSRAKDIYDLSIFLPKADVALTRKALSACFKYRDTTLPDSLKTHVSKIDTTVLKAGWPSAVSGIAGAPTFDDAFQKVLDHLPS